MDLGSAGRLNSTAFTQSGFWEFATQGHLMASYRLYRVSNLTRRFAPAEEFDANDDRTAIAIAERIRTHRQAELWSGSRVVQEWKG
jgi:hypothetical protein